MIRKIILLVFFLTIVIAIQAQSTYLIQGTIFDLATNQPIPNALIEIKSQNVTTRSDENGYYKLQVDPIDKSIISCSLLGYQSQTQSILIEEVTYFDFELQPIFERLNTYFSQTPQRASKITLDLPEATALISNQQLQINTPRTTAEALTGTTGISIFKTHHGGGTPIFRGLTTNHNLVLIDGIRLNHSLSGALPSNFLNSIDVLSLDKIDLLHGGKSSLYGSDAMGGTINLLTKTPELPLNEAVTTGHGHVLAKYRSGNMERLINAEGQFNIKKNVFLLGGSFKDFGDLVSANGSSIKYSAYGENSLYAKAIIPIKRGKITLATFNNRQNNQEVSNLILYNKDEYFEQFKYDAQNYHLTYGKFQYISRSNWVRIIKGHLAYQYNDLQLTSQGINQSVFQEKWGVHTVSANIEGTSNLPKNIKMLSGIDFNQDILHNSKFSIDSINNQTAVQSFYPTGGLNTQIGIYNKYSIRFPKGQMNFGWRYQMNRINQSDTIFGQMNTTPSSLGANIGSLYQLTKNQRLTANIHTNYRLPNLHDFGGIGQFTRNFETGIIVPNLELKAERSLTFELGYKIQTSRIGGNISFYRTQLYNFMHLTASTYLGEPIFRNEAVYKLENIINGYVQGIETEWDILFNNKFFGGINLTYATGENTTKNQPPSRNKLLGLVPTLNGRIFLHYQPRKNIKIIATYLFAGEQQFISELGITGIQHFSQYRTNTDAWQIVNLTAQLQFKKVDIVVGVNNIFNKSYAMHNSRITEYGRNAVFTVKWKF